MYGLSLQSGGWVRSADLQRALSDLPFECGSELHSRRMAFLGSIESLEARGMLYSNQDFDVLSGALNFLDAVAPEVSETLRAQSVAIALPAKVGDSIDFKAHGKVWYCKRLNLNTWFLAAFRETGSERARFGDALDIRDDIAHIFATGCLPQSKSAVA